MTDKHIKQKLRVITLLMLLMGGQPMLIFQFFPKETASWIAGFNFVALSLIILFGLWTMRASFRRSIGLGIGFLIFCFVILTGHYMEWDMTRIHQVSSIFYLIWLGVFVVESYLVLKNKTRVDDPGL